MSNTQQVTVPPGMQIVEKEEFYSAIGPRDINPHPQPHHTSWEARNRIVVGRTLPGYLSVGPRVYMLDRAAIAKVPVPK
jgi:hypothetical protein